MSRSGPLGTQRHKSSHPFAADHEPSLGTLVASSPLRSVACADAKRTAKSFVREFLPGFTLRCLVRSSQGESLNRPHARGAFSDRVFLVRSALLREPDDSHLDSAFERHADCFGLVKNQEFTKACLFDAVAILQVGFPTWPGREKWYLPAGLS